MSFRGSNAISEFHQILACPVSGSQIAIAQIINSKAMVVGDSHHSYNSTITVTIKKGIYYLGYSIESSTESIFTSELKFGVRLQT
jgi:hypothetical protein